MSMLPTNIARVPNRLLSQLSLSHINRSSVGLFRVQEQLSTGRAINRPSDDPVRGATIGVLDDRLERGQQLLRNLSHADSALGLMDDAMVEATDLATQARGVAADQLSITSSASERSAQAVVIDQILQSMLGVAQRQSPSGYMFGGGTTSEAPVIAFGSGYRYLGQGDGMTTDLAPYGQIPITLGRSSNPIGETSARLRGDVDLNPNLTTDTKLSDLGGARGLGVSLGVVEVSVNGGARVSVDLSGADTIGDVAARLNAAIRTYETDNTVSVLGPGGVGVSGGAVSFDFVAGPPSPSLQFFDPVNGITAQDLGLSSTTPAVFDGSNAVGASLEPRLTWRTPVSELAGVTGAVGSIKLSNLGRSATIDLSGAQTLQDIRNAIEGTGLGLRVEINADGTGIDVVNEVASGRTGAMSIEEVSGQNLTATRLGIRSLTGSTRLSDFNDGRGVGVVTGSLNPLTGLADPTLDVDLRITLGNGPGTVLSIDLRPQDVATVQTVIDRINSEAAAQLAAAGLPATAFQAGLSDGANGIVLRQDAGFGSPIRVAPANNSPAAEQLGFLGGSYDSTSASFVTEDRAKVRVDNLFTHLVDLRDALRGNDTRGISIAGENLERALGEIAEVRGLIGGYAQRLESATTREQDRAVLDESIRSQLRDTDFAAAATKLNLLQTQLQAGLQVTALSQQQTLLDFIG